MKFRVCNQCGKEKTERQFSIRKPNTCRACLGNVPSDTMTAHTPYDLSFPVTSHIHNITSTQLIRPHNQGKPEPKIIKLKETNSNMGFVVVNEIKAPEISVFSAEFEALSPVQKRAVLKAHKRYRRVMDARNTKVLPK